MSLMRHHFKLQTSSERLILVDTSCTNILASSPNILTHKMYKFLHIGLYIYYPLLKVVWSVCFLMMVSHANDTDIAKQLVPVK